MPNTGAPAAAPKVDSEANVALVSGGPADAICRPPAARMSAVPHPGGVPPVPNFVNMKVLEADEATKPR